MVTKFDQVLGSFSFVTKVNAAALESARDEEQRAANFKTPQTKKQRSLVLDKKEGIGISPYACSLLNGPKEFEEMKEREQMEKLIEMVISLDSGVDQLGSFYVSLSQETKNSGNLQGLLSQMLEH